MTNGGRRNGDWAKAPDSVGRKTRRAEDLAFRLDLFAPVLSRAVRVAWSNMFPNARTGPSTILSVDYIHGAAQNRRDYTQKETKLWARRVFRPTESGDPFAAFLKNLTLTCHRSLCFIITRYIQVRN
jgi:hypothetical protein